jgi:DNA-binding IclR family transcriptional regulator
LLQGKSPGSVVALAEARELLGLSREQTVQFLESLDERGILRRDGHVHRMIKRLETE